MYTTEFYSVIKKEILPFADKWMELENIMLSEPSQVQKDKGHMFSIYVGNRYKYNYHHIYNMFPKWDSSRRLMKEEKVWCISKYITSV
jgi:hypothetical protein